MRRMGVVAFVVMAVLILVGVVAVAVSQTERPDQAAGIRVAQAPGGAADREARAAQYMEQLRQRLTAAGATAADVAAIEAHRTKQREIRAPLEGAMDGLRQASGAEATDAQAKDAVAKYEAAMKTALANLAKAEQDLKTKLDLANKPKLHALLLSMGTLDNGMRGGGGFMGGRGGAGGGGAPGGRGGGARGGGGGTG